MVGQDRAGGVPFSVASLILSEETCEHFEAIAQGDWLKMPIEVGDLPQLWTVSTLHA
jgi:NTP pyrophosphatase (non-canonical NTP hydrolase)